MRPIKSSQVVEILGITQRMLDRWVGSGVVPTTSGTALGTGLNRLYDFKGLFVAGVVSRLPTGDMALEEVWGVAAYVSDFAVEYDEPNDELGFLVVYDDGQIAHVERGQLEAAFIDLNKDARSATVMDLHDVADVLRAHVFDILVLGKEPKGRRRGSRYRRQHVETGR